MTVSEQALNAQNPWPGLQAYGEGDRQFYFGRQTEIADLLWLVQRNTLTVVFGPSGTGKSSLVRAGLFGELSDAGVGRHSIRLSHGASLVAQVQEELGLQGETLWEGFHRLPGAAQVVVFDQFEEIFTLGDGREESEEFLTQLADVVENYYPESVRTRLESGETLEFEYGRQQHHIVLVLREDFVWRLDGLRARMPSVMGARFPVQPFSVEQALKAVEEPGREVVDHDAALQIVQFATGKRGPKLVDPAILSLLCRELNKARAPGSKISPTQLEGDSDAILSRFWEESVQSLAPTDQEPVREFIEDRLVSENGFRTAAPRDEVAEYEAAVRVLIDQRRLLRGEDRFGTPHLELTHDVLCPVVHRTRQERRQRAEQAALAQQVEFERMAAEIRQEAEKRELQRSFEAAQAEAEERANRAKVALLKAQASRNRLAAVLLAFLAVIAIGGLLLALRARSEAEKQRIRADKQRVRAEENSKLALRNESLAVFNFQTAHAEQLRAEAERGKAESERAKAAKALIDTGSALEKVAESERKLRDANALLAGRTKDAEASAAQAKDAEARALESAKLADSERLKTDAASKKLDAANQLRIAEQNYRLEAGLPLDYLPGHQVEHVRNLLEQARVLRSFGESYIPLNVAFDLYRGLAMARLLGSDDSLLRSPVLFVVPNPAHPERPQVFRQGTSAGELGFMSPRDRWTVERGTVSQAGDEALAGAGGYLIMESKGSRDLPARKIFPFAMTGIGFSTDGQWLAMADSSSNMRIERVSELESKKLFSRKLVQVASGIKLAWFLSIRHFQGEYPVRQLALHLDPDRPDDRRDVKVAALTESGKLMTWEGPGPIGKQLGRMEGRTVEGLSFSAIATNPKTQEIWAASEGSFGKLSFSVPPVVGPLHLLGPGISSMAWNEKGTLLALGMRDGSLTVISDDHENRVEIPAHGAGISSIVWNGNLLATGAMDGSARVWTMEVDAEDSALRRLAALRNNAPLVGPLTGPEFDRLYARVIAKLPK